MDMIVLAIWRLSGHGFIQSSLIFVIIPLSVSQAWALGSQSRQIYVYLFSSRQIFFGDAGQSIINPLKQHIYTFRVCFARTITEIFLGSIQHAIIASSGGHRARIQSNY